MNIDRHNYEEYFLLYIDNELNVEQKKQVEAFVLVNPDLEEELVMLQQSRLIPDDSIVFEGKELLMKKESGPITIDNYEQWLVMYVDNELTAEEKLAVEKFADTTPTVRAELNLFLQTKLEPQKDIVFPNKESLYRTEVKVKVRVISMRWLRVAAVITFLLASGFGIYSIVSNNGKQNGTAKNTPVVTAPKNSSQSNIVEPGNSTANKTQNENQDQNNAITPGVQEQHKQPVFAQQNQKTSVTQPSNIAAGKNSIQQQPQQEQQIAKIDPDENNGNSVIDGARNNDTKTNVSPIDSKNTGVADNNVPQKENNITVTKSNPETPQIGTTDSTQTGDVAESSGNKKLRGIFRRATRFIERTTKMDPADQDGKVLIGAVAVSLK